MIKSLIIAGYGIKLSVKKGYLIIKGKESSKEVPLSEVEQLVIATSGVTITSKALRLITDYGVDLVVLDSRGFPVSRFYHPYITRTVDVRRAQYMSYFTELGIKLVKNFAYIKVMNQAKYLISLNRLLKETSIKESAYDIEAIAERILKLPKTYISQFRKDVMKLEAQAARIYWSSIALAIPNELNFEGRDQDGSDITNISLNYGYGILYSECWKALVLAGLDPYAGFLHADKSGKPTLVFDFIEMFRVAAVDSVIIKLLRSGWRGEVKEGMLTPKARLDIVKAVNDGLEKRFRVKPYSESLTLRQWIRKSARDLAKALISNKEFVGPIFRW